MSGRFDIIVVGAGHNGLVAAAYLARAGRSVLVLERSSTVGGTAQTREFAPGFRASSGFQSAETLSPSVVKELKLASHGFSLSNAGGTVLARTDGWIRFDGRGRLVEGGGAAADAATATDKAALHEFQRLVGRMVRALAPLYEAPLPDLEQLGVGTKLDLLRVGWRLRRLGRRDMQAAMRLLPMSMRDIVEERFEGSAVQALVAGLGLQGGWLGPYAAGTGFRALHDQMPNPRPLMSGPAFVRGGMGALTKALAESARGGGAEIRTDSEVARIDSEGGAARGVTLVSGEHVEAGVVVSDADPHHTFLSLLDAAALKPEFVTAARGMRAHAGVALVTFALDSLPGAPAGAGDVAQAMAGRVQIGASIADLERAFDAAPMGAMPDRPAVQLFVPTLSDPDLAPAGRHVATAWVQAVPRRLAERAGEADGWGSERDSLADTVTALIDEVLPGFANRVSARDVSAPPDLEERFAATEGCLFDLDLGLDQALYLRPLPRWCGYRAPVAGVYLCGSGTHGGGGITGLAGRNAARRVLDDIRAGESRRSG